jgi:hypothetical protein
MRLNDEDSNKVLVNDLPTSSEYQHILFNEQEAGQVIRTNYAKFNELNNKAWADILLLMEKCIARGIRLAKERNL